MNQRFQSQCPLDLPGRLSVASVSPSTEKILRDSDYLYLVVKGLKGKVSLILERNLLPSIGLVTHVSKFVSEHIQRAVICLAQMRRTLACHMSYQRMDENTRKRSGAEPSGWVTH